MATRKKVIALVAHDGKKADLLDFVQKNRNRLSKYRLIATKTTGRMVTEKLGLTVRCFHSGPYGGDAEIAARVVVGGVHAVIFITDPMDAHPHDPDIHTLLRVCNVHNIPIATNIATANMIVGKL